MVVTNGQLPPPERKKRTFRPLRALRRLGRLIAFAACYWGWQIVKLVFRPVVVFAVYGEERHQRAYWPSWVHRRLRTAFPIGVILIGRGWRRKIGLTVASKQPAEAFDGDSSPVLDYLDAIRREVPRSGPVALAGRLPTWAGRAGRPAQTPFVDGSLGTRFAMRAVILRGARELEIPTNKICLALLGGAGRIGSLLVDDVAGDFGEVVAFDPRFESTNCEGNVVRTAEYPQLQRANLVLVLTSKGEDIVDAVPFFAEGTVLVDDTHPDIPPRLRKELTERSVRVLKAVTADGRLRMIPRLPGYRGSSIPGCLVEALVVARHGSSVTESSEQFFKAAQEMGFAPHLIKHPGGE